MGVGLWRGVRQLLPFVICPLSSAVVVWSFYLWFKRNKLRHSVIFSPSTSLSLSNSNSSSNNSTQKTNNNNNTSHHFSNMDELLRSLSIFLQHISVKLYPALQQLFNSLLKKIPILRTIYSAIVQMTESFTKQGKNKKSILVRSTTIDDLDYIINMAEIGRNWLICVDEIFICLFFTVFLYPRTFPISDISFFLHFYILLFC
jgi:hypothetical protein